MKEAFFAVDRIEQSTVVLEGDDGRSFEVPIKKFGKRPTEGTVFRVRLDASGAPDWSHLIVDAGEAKQRLAKAKKTMDAKRAADDGGDFKL